jgi:hypothetical protein
VNASCCLKENAENRRLTGQNPMHNQVNSISLDHRMVRPVHGIVHLRLTVPRLIVLQLLVMVNMVQDRRFQVLMEAVMVDLQTVFHSDRPLEKPAHIASDQSEMTTEPAPTATKNCGKNLLLFPKR